VTAKNAKTSQMRNFLFGMLIITFASCQGQQKEASKTESNKFEKVELTQPQIKQQKQGIDFVANEKDRWSVEIDFDGKVNFKEGKRDSTTLNISDFTIEKGIAQYEDDEISIVLKPKKSGADTLFSHDIEIAKGKKTYIGEGNYLNKSIELVGEWRLAQVDSIKTRPVSIHFQDAIKLIGYDGCNQFFGHYHADQDFIYFDAISATRKACMEAPIDAIPNQMGSKVAYTIKQNKLTMLKSDSTTVTLKRVINE
jgi:heat shock protein HslJ